MRRVILLSRVCLALFVFSACTTSGGSDADTTTTAGTSTDETQGDGEADLFADRCDPSTNAMSDACAGFASAAQCCSDDPAAIELDDINALVTPNYQGRGGVGTPVFSGGNNPLSRQGACVTTGSIAPTYALADINAQGCPVPCNPTWSATDIASVCGQGSLCCQVQELGAEDCVFDTELGDGGCFRPVTGNDIIGFGGADLTIWATTEHLTHQDPGGVQCEAFVAAIPEPVLSGAGLTASEVLLACFRRLTVANQRGFCFDGETDCPYAGPGYVDACEALNADNGLSGC